MFHWYDIKTYFKQLFCNHVTYYSYSYNYRVVVKTKHHSTKYDVFEKRYCDVCDKHIDTTKVKSNQTHTQVQLYLGHNTIKRNTN